MSVTKWVTEVTEVKHGQVQNITMDSVTLYNNGKRPILNHLDRQFTCTCIGLSNFQDIKSVFSIEILIHGVNCWRITHHSKYNYNSQITIVLREFFRSTLVYLSIQRSTETSSSSLFQKWQSFGFPVVGEGAKFKFVDRYTVGYFVFLEVWTFAAP